MRWGDKMNLEEFFLAFQDFQNEIGQLIDEGDRELTWLWEECDHLLAILEGIINLGKSGETK